MSVVEVAAAVVAVVGAADDVWKKLENTVDWAKRSAIIEITNLTAERWDFTDVALHSGTLAQPHPTVIEPFSSIVLAGVSTATGQGAIADLHFRARDLVLNADYSNPVAGENDFDATILGPRADEFRWTTSAGPGNKNARFRCDIWQDWQDNWRFCPKCHGLFAPGAGSRCPAGGSHVPLGWNYLLLHDVSAGPNLQTNWRYCARCRTLFAEGDGNGLCPAGGAHDPVGWNYCVPHDLVAGPHLQADWRFCARCRVLFGEGNGNGVCPAGGPHTPLGWPYLAAFATP